MFTLIAIFVSWTALIVLTVASVGFIFEVLLLGYRVYKDKNLQDTAAWYLINHSKFMGEALTVWTSGRLTHKCGMVAAFILAIFSVLILLGKIFDAFTNGVLRMSAWIAIGIALLGCAMSLIALRYVVKSGLTELVDWLNWSKGKALDSYNTANDNKWSLWAAFKNRRK